MSSFSARAAVEKDRKNEAGRDDEDEESSAAESEEVDQLLLSYRKNAPKKRSIRRGDLDSPTSANGGGGGGGGVDEIVVVSIEHYEKPEIADAENALGENSLTSPSDTWLQNESTCSSTSLLRDLLPHLSESNTNAVSSSSNTGSSFQSSLLTKTYTEPTSLSGLLRQVGNKLFSHYPSRVVRRHSRISPTASIHCKLDDGDDLAASSQATVLTTAASTPLRHVDDKTDENNDDAATITRQNSFPSLVSSPSSAVSPNTSLRRFLDQQKQEKLRKRPQSKQLLCKRCPHCRKTCSLRKISVPESSRHDDANGGGGDLSYRHDSASTNNAACSCRICMILESVESTLSSTSTDGDGDGGGMRTNNLPASSTTTIDLSSFSNDDAPCGDSRQGLLDAGHVSSLELGLFCDECNTAASGVGGQPQHNSTSGIIVSEISTCCQQKLPQQQKSREQGIQVNSSSMASIATTSSFGGPVCRICHSPGDKLQPLISPCRCLGTLKYVHASCLLHWLDISSRKLRRPPHCELCGYRYQRHKTMKLRRIQWPTCSRRDKLYHVLFLVSVLMMIACAAVTIVCFKADRGQTRTSDDGAVIKKATGGGAAAVGANANSHVELSGQEVVTLVCGILFFCAFFVAMYVQVKAQTTVYKLCVRFWTMNQEWRVDEYRREKDAEYWRQRLEQQQLQLQQQQRRASAQLSSASAAATATTGTAAAAAAGGVNTPLILQQQEQLSRHSLSLSRSSSSSFRADVLNGID